MQINLHGPAYGIDGLQVEQLPFPAARFTCNSLVSGNDGGHSVHLRELGRRGMRPHGHFKGADDGVLPSATTSRDAWRWWRPGSANA